MSKRKIVEKIQKLLALSRSDNENEASSAYAMVEAMLSKNNLYKVEVERDPLKDRYLYEFVDHNKNKGAGWQFIQTLVRQYFHVDIVQTKKRKENSSILDAVTNSNTSHYHVIFGEEKDVELAKNVSEFLMKSFVGLFAQYRRYARVSLKMRDSFYTGLYKGFNEQLAQREQRIKEKEMENNPYKKDIEAYEASFKDPENEFIKEMMSRVGIAGSGDEVVAGPFEEEQKKSKGSGKVSDQDIQAFRAGYERGLNFRMFRDSQDDTKDDKK